MNKKLVLKYVVVLILCTALTVFYVSSKGIRNKRPADRYKILADGFTIPGLLVTGFGLMMVISDTGTLDGVIYGMQTAFRMLTFQLLSKGKQQPNYSDFKDHREEMRQLRRLRGGGFGFMIITGGAFLAAAVVFVFLYLKATGAL